MYVYGIGGKSEKRTQKFLISIRSLELSEKKKNYILNVEQMVWCVRVCHQKEIKKNKKKEASFHSVKEKKGVRKWRDKQRGGREKNESMLFFPFPTHDHFSPPRLFSVGKGFLHPKSILSFFFSFFSHFFFLRLRSLTLLRPWETIRSVRGLVSWAPGIWV